jgi:DNA-directed RNA polymerase sigma subunit (sigma70/sigma32)
MSVEMAGSARYTGYVGAKRFEDDPVAIYLREVYAIPALTRDEEIELYQHVLANDQQADFAAKRLIDSNLAMVVAIAEGHRDAGMHVLDLIQEGNEGLKLALRTFRGDSGESFSDHAAACVKDAIAKALAKK